MSSSVARNTGLMFSMLFALAPAQADVGRPMAMQQTDPAALAAALLHRALPGEAITVRTANAGLVLSGQVSGPEALQRALALAERHAPGRVSNLMTTGRPPAVTLTLGLAEMPPEVARNLTASMAVAGIFALESSDPDLFGGAGAVLGLPGRDLDLPGLVVALEAKGVLRLHAGPVLSARAGEALQVTAGTGCAGAAGAGLGLMPGLAADGQMTLTIRPCGSVGAAEVTVTLQDGQTVAVAGVLPERAALAGDPVFGAALAEGEGHAGLTEMMLLISARIAGPEAVAEVGGSDLPQVTPVAADSLEPFTLFAPRLR